MEFINLKEAGAPLPLAVARLADYHHRQGSRVLILARDKAQAEELDRVLWSFRPDSFLPHAVAGAEDQAMEPVLISLSAKNLNQARVLIMAEALDDPPLDDYPRLIQFVPAEPGPELDASRARYKALKESGKAKLLYITQLP